VSSIAAGLYANTVCCLRVCCANIAMICTEPASRDKLFQSGLGRHPALNVVVVDDADKREVALILFSQPAER